MNFTSAGIDAANAGLAKALPGLGSRHSQARVTE